MADHDDRARANPGYALGQLARALTTSEGHKDAGVRARAEEKIGKWVQVFEGMLNGALDVGSRTPVADTPGWATLEVLAGGFASGNLLAAGELQEHERELLDRIDWSREAPPRAVLNSYFLSEVGLEELRRMLHSGCFRIKLPEEGALLVVAWLLEQDRAAKARALLDEIGPFFAQLRFYPIPDPRPLLASSVVRVQDIGQTIADLAAVHVNLAYDQLREAIEVWNPLYDRVVALFAETVEGELPSLQLGDDGKPRRDANGGFFIEGSWPCQRYADDWRARARALIDTFTIQRKQHPLCKKPVRRSENFSRLIGYLQTCIESPRKLSGRDVGMIRLILASITTSRGLPGSERHAAVRAQQALQVARPTDRQLAEVLRARLEPLPRDEGLDSLEQVAAPVAQEEAQRFAVPADAVPSDKLRRHMLRCLNAPVEALVDLGVISSGEVLAKVIPQITAQVQAAGIAVPELRWLYGAIYTAFRRRRSLLLLNLESQIKLEELPWVAAVNAQRSADLGTRARARQTLEQVVSLALGAFPHVILPNKLLQELRALSASAELGIPIVDEVAADIFMGDFSEKFLRAAQRAGELLAGRLYETYYGIDYRRLRELADVKASRHGASTSRAFYLLCEERAGAGGGSWSVARNGTIIEQEQILTTHNLAVLFHALDLGATMGYRLEDLSRRCFEWICWRQGLGVKEWRAQLQSAKNCAYAWRQMVFFLSQLARPALELFLAWAAEHLAKQRPETRERLLPALRGLQLAAQGHAPGSSDWEQEGARLFLGWETGKHWLLQ